MKDSEEKIFGSPKVVEERLVEPGKGSKTELRYTPAKESGFLIEICEDSLEVPKAKSKLVEFKQVRGGEEKQVVMPLFFHSKKLNHQRQGSLKANRKSDISEMLLGLREKPKPKSSLKSGVVKKHKTVSFCSQIEQLSLGVKSQAVLEDSLESVSRSAVSTNLPLCSNEKFESKCETNSSTQHNLENCEDLEEGSIIGTRNFRFEEAVRRSLKDVEFREYSTIAFCEACDKEVVTVVSFERVRGESCGEIAEWFMCWVLPDCMYKRKRLLHKCPHCSYEIIKLDW